MPRSPLSIHAKVPDEIPANQIRYKLLHHDQVELFLKIQSWLIIYKSMMVINHIIGLTDKIASPFQ